MSKKVTKEKEVKKEAVKETVKKDVAVPPVKPPVVADKKAEEKLVLSKENIPVAPKVKEAKKMNLPPTGHYEVAYMDGPTCAVYSPLGVRVTAANLTYDEAVKLVYKMNREAGTLPVYEVTEKRLK